MNNSTTIKLKHIPLRPLGTWLPGPTPTAADGATGPILPRKGQVAPLRTGLDCRATAGRGGTTRLQGTHRGSNSLSWTSFACRKKTEATPIDGGRDMACDRYTHRYIHYGSKYIKS